MAVCDKFLSNGWIDKKNEKIDNSNTVSRLSGIGDYRNNKPLKKTNKNIFLILASMPRYYYTGWSAPQGPIFANYLTNLSSLNNYISDDVKTRILCRSYTYDYGWNDQDYLEKNDFNFPSGRRKELKSLMKKNALNVFTYNSTALLEAFANNYILCCYWNPVHWAWRDEAKDDLIMLEECGIYHSNIQSLAHFLNKHNTNELLNLWWSSDSVQLARNRFCEKYAKTNSDEIKYWGELLS